MLRGTDKRLIYYVYKQIYSFRMRMKIFKIRKIYVFVVIYDHILYAKVKTQKLDEEKFKIKDMQLLNLKKNSLRYHTSSFDWLRFFFCIFLLYKVDQRTTW